MTERATVAVDSESKEVFAYRSLKTPASLRLLSVLPDSKDDRIQVELREVTEPQSYQCLSYVWGDQTKRFPVQLNGCAATVEKSLYDFLQVAAQRFPGEPLWIDGLCINQTDDREKSLQVQRMGAIYGNADGVIVWLGNHQGISALFEWIGNRQHAVSRALHHVSIDQFDKPPAHLRKYILDLIYHPYWKRAWIHQEVLLAKSLNLLCGPIEVSPAALLKCGEASFVNMARHDFYALVDLSFIVRFLGRAQYGRYKSLWSIFAGGVKGKMLQCADPRDRTYSLLAITRQDEMFKVDYKESLFDLFCRSVHHFAPGFALNEVRALWDALELNPTILQEAAKTRSGPNTILCPHTTHQTRS
jgi:hypothetical protein